MTHEILRRPAGRRTLLKAGLALGAAPFAAPFVITARAADTVKIGSTTR